jgi:hypothetical protein
MASVARILAAGTAALCAALSGCSSPVGDARTRPDAPASSTATAGSPSPTVTGVRRPWRPGLPQLGVAVYWQNTPADSDELVRGKAAKIFDYIVEMGANSLSLSFPFVMDSASASAVRSDQAMTPDPGRLAIVLAEAKARKLRTTVRPMLSELNLTKDDPDVWRGSITPKDRAKWFTSYRDLLVPYAKACAEADVATLVVGTELNSMEDSPGWQVVVKGVRAVYRGELGYSANHDRLRGPAPTAGLIKSVDAYPPLKVGDDASVGQLIAGWDRWLDGKGTGPLRDLVLAEVAIAAQPGAYVQPWSPHARGPIKPKIQERWFDAACQTVARRKLAGIYFWMINMDSEPAAASPPDDAPMDFVGRPAERNVTACFTRLTR